MISTHVTPGQQKSDEAIKQRGSRRNFKELNASPEEQRGRGTHAPVLQHHQKWTGAIGEKSKPQPAGIKKPAHGPGAEITPAGVAVEIKEEAHQDQDTQQRNDDGGVEVIRWEHPTNRNNLIH